EAGSASIDVAKLVQLHSLLGDAFAPLVASFISNAALYVAQIEAAVHSGQKNEAVAVAHKLKSSAAQLGLPDLSKAAERVERGDPADNLSALKLERERICGALEQTAASISGGGVRQ